MTISSEMEKEAAEIKTDIPKITLAPYTMEETVTETEPETESCEDEEDEQSEETAKPEEKEFLQKWVNVVDYEQLNG